VHLLLWTIKSARWTVHRIKIVTVNIRVYVDIYKHIYIYIYIYLTQSDSTSWSLTHCRWTPCISDTFADITCVWACMILQLRVNFRDARDYEMLIPFICWGLNLVYSARRRLRAEHGSQMNHQFTFVSKQVSLYLLWLRNLRIQLFRTDKAKNIGFTKKIRPGGKSVIADSLLQNCFQPKGSPEVTGTLWSLDKEQT